jgi:hypothetical protein
MTIQMTEEERQRQVREDMEVNHVPVSEVHIRVAIEAGDIPGDGIPVDEENAGAADEPE